ncbi:MAG: hypothetical protein AAF960_03465 [Bacteroidota bacterium]
MLFPNQKEIRRSLFSVLVSAATLVVVGSCIALVYTLCGDSFDFRKQVSKKEVVPSASNSLRSSATSDLDEDRIENGIHLASGLIYGDHFDLVRAHCTACHSGKLVAQNRATREGWQQMIRWMQETQGLWELGANEPKILDYLAANYGPEEVGRRANIDMAAVEWYILELE